MIEKLEYSFVVFLACLIVLGYCQLIAKACHQEAQFEQSRLQPYLQAEQDMQMEDDRKNAAWGQDGQN